MRGKACIIIQTQTNITENLVSRREPFWMLAAQNRSQNGLKTTQFSTLKDSVECRAFFMGVICPRWLEELIVGNGPKINKYHTYFARQWEALNDGIWGLASSLGMQMPPQQSTIVREMHVLSFMCMNDHQHEEGERIPFQVFPQSWWPSCQMTLIVINVRISTIVGLEGVY